MVELCDVGFWIVDGYIESNFVGKSCKCATGSEFSHHYNGPKPSDRCSRNRDEKKSSLKKF